MPAPTIDYLNARRALLPASGGTNYKLREAEQYAKDYMVVMAVWPIDHLRSRLMDLSLIAEALRARAAKLPRYVEPEIEIPF